MSVEATLKKQAKDILAKDNWQKSILGFLCILSVLCIVFMIADLSTLLITDDILSKPLNLAIIIGVALLGAIGLVLLTPIYTGYIKFIANSKNSETGKIQDIFHYFNKERYFSTVYFNLGLFLRYSLLFILCAAPITACLILMYMMPEYETAFKIGALWAGIVGAVVYFFLTRFWVVAQYLYVADFNYRKEREIIKASRYIVKKNYGKIISLYISFIVYGLLCFFVIPVVFVYPYFKHTAVLSYSYLYELEKTNPQSPYFATGEYQPQQAVTDAEKVEGADDTVQPIEENEKKTDDLSDVQSELNETNNDKSEENELEFDNN